MNKLVVANWKMSLGYKETLELCDNINKIDTASLNLVICPSTLYLPNVAEMISLTNVSLGAQDCSHKAIMAFTGGVNAAQLKEIGCQFVIVGHSERRIYAHETGKEISDKITHLIEHSITPILCIGEDNISHNAHKTKQVISMQLDEIDLKTDWSKIIIAYEPIWAIGSGEIPKSYEIAEVSNHIKSKVNPYKVLYGGSVNKSNVKELSVNCNVDGFLIGSASIKFNELQAILAEVQ